MKTWFVTGASKGIGQRLVRQLLARGDRVAATSRTVASLTEALGPACAQFLPLQVDLDDEQSIGDAIAQTIEKFGKVDVVVNNAGYAQQGTVEALCDDELRHATSTSTCSRRWRCCGTSFRICARNAAAM